MIMLLIFCILVYYRFFKAVEQNELFLDFVPQKRWFTVSVCLVPVEGEKIAKVMS